MFWNEFFHWHIVSIVCLFTLSWLLRSFMSIRHFWNVSIMKMISLSWMTEQICYHHRRNFYLQGFCFFSSLYDLNCVFLLNPNNDSLMFLSYSYDASHLAFVSLFSAPHIHISLVGWFNCFCFCHDIHAYRLSCKESQRQ